MNSRQMMDLAFFLTTDNIKTSIGERDLYYDPIRDVFVHRPAACPHNRYASLFVNGRNTQSWINSNCIHVGRYEVDVNPFWIIEDMKSVQ